MGIEEEIENSVLLDAYNVVHEERDPEYGPASEDFESLGIIWGTLLSRWLKKHDLPSMPNIPPRVVGNMMIALKIIVEVVLSCLGCQTMLQCDVFWSVDTF